MNMPDVSNTADALKNFRSGPAESQEQPQKEGGFNKLLGAIIALVLACIGGWLGFACLNDVLQGQASQSWPTAEGKVVSATVRTETSTRKGRTRTYYKPEITYNFEVEGKQYSGNRLQFGPLSTTDQQEAYTLTNGLANAEVPIHYNPKNPEDSVIIPGIVNERLYLTIGGLIAMVGAAGFSVFRFIQWRKL